MKDPRHMGTAALGLATVVFATFACVWCAPAPLPEPPHVVVDSFDAGACSEACARLREFGCGEGYGTARGTTCSGTCVRAIEQGMLPPDWTDCVLRIDPRDPQAFGRCRLKCTATPQ